ncbi:MAG TPA: methyltransferase domain-containing protein [Ktedonobacteraceae bacterium]|nr:methyltransferase domain-containing protein [Ktedonobacteraceae bacterium]
MMPQVYDSSNRYVIDIENGAETARLLAQDQLYTRAMGGILPEHPDPCALEQVLDLACGPGGWALELGFAYRDMQVIGVDINASMIGYARALARVQHLDNVTFQVMDVTQSLAFATHSFDLVNARFLVGFLEQAGWPPLLAECLRVLKPGGILRLTECEQGISSSPALQQLGRYLTQALSQQGRTFSADGQTIGIAHMLGTLLHHAGFVQIQRRAFLLDSSYGEPLYAASCKQMEVTFALLKPYLIHSGVVEEGAFDDLYYHMLMQTIHEDFCCVSFGLTAWAMKPPW